VIGTGGYLDLISGPVNSPSIGPTPRCKIKKKKIIRLWWRELLRVCVYMRFSMLLLFGNG
jgi:hypothetical protein